VHRRPLLPLGDRCWMEMIAFRKFSSALLTMLDCPTHRRCRAGAAVEYLSPKASRDGNASYFIPYPLGLNSLDANS
jgi:hypothetical protein